MSIESERLSIIAQEMDRMVQDLVSLRIRVEQLEKALHDLEGRYVLTLVPKPKEGEWTITPVPKFTEG